MDNIGMFSDAYPACPFPKSFSFQIKKSGEPVKTSPALPDSTEDIKMFDSPERDSEDFERSLKKTMECIAQVCDTTVPDPTNTPLVKPHYPDSNTTPLKPGSLKPPPYPDPDHPQQPSSSPDKRALIPEQHGRRGDPGMIGPITSKKFGTPPHHPYQRPKRAKLERHEEEHTWQDARDQIWGEEKLHKPPQYPVEQGLADRKLRQYQPDPRSPYTDQSNQQQQCKKSNPNPEHFIFPECTAPDLGNLQKEFFMFYMQKCLQQNITDPPPYSMHGGPTSLMTSSQHNTSLPSSQEKRFVDSTTSPINPQFLENKENYNHSPAQVQGPGYQEQISCKYSSPTADSQGQDVKPQRLHFNFPSPVPPTDQTFQPPPRTPNPATPIMGPSLDAAAVLGPSPGYYNRSGIPVAFPTRVPDHPGFSGSGHGVDSGSDSLSSIRPTIQHEPEHGSSEHQRSSSHSPTPPRVPEQFRDSYAGPGSRDQFTSSRDQFTSSRDQFTSSRDQFASSRDQYTPSGDQYTPSGDHPPPRSAEPHKTPHQHRPGPHLAGRPPNLPPHLFPDSRHSQFHSPPPPRGFPPALPQRPRSANLPLHGVRQDMIHAMRAQMKPPDLGPLRPADIGYFDPARSMAEGMRSSLDKAIPDNLAAGYIPHPDVLNKPFTPPGEFFGHSSNKEKFSFRETIGKMLSKKKNVAAAEINPTGKRTKFTNEQISILEHYYHNVNKYVTGSNKGTLCQVTGLELSTILMWFQNKRAREKKQKTNV